MDEDPPDFVMYVDMLDGVPPGALYNVDQYGQKLAAAMRCNFYVDDLLKSVNDLETAKIPVKSEFNMSKIGTFLLSRFPLTKVVSRLRTC